jgi:MFS family permease
MDFSVSFSTAKWIVLSYLMATTVFSLIIGRLADLAGRRRILLWGAALFAIGSLVSALSASFAALIIGRVIQGVGAAALVVLPIAIATDALPQQKMGRAIGLLATMSAVGTATGPSIGGFLIAEFNWRAVFIQLTVLAGLTLLFVVKFVHLGRGSSSLQQSGFLESIGSFSGDVTLRKHLFSNLVVSAVMILTLIVGPFYLTHALLLDPGQMGLVMSAGPLTSILSGTIAGYAVDRFGSNFIIKFGFLQLLLGAIAFVFLPLRLGTLGFAFSAVLLSFGYQLFLSANSSSLMTSARTEHRGIAAGALNLSRNLGLISGTYLLGGIFDFFSERTDISTAIEKRISDGFQITFSVAALLIAYLLIHHIKHNKGRTYEKRFVN